MFPIIVFVLHGLRGGLDVRIQQFGPGGHFGTFFHNNGIVYGFVCILAPGKDTV